MDEAREMNINDYLQQRFDNDLLVDVRDAVVFDCGSIPGAVNVPLAEIRRLYQLPRDKKICVFCQSGEISRNMTELLLDAGYDAYHLSGGYRERISSSISSLPLPSLTGKEKRGISFSSKRHISILIYCHTQCFTDHRFHLDHFCF